MAVTRRIFLKLVVLFLGSLCVPKISHVDAQAGFVTEPVLFGDRNDVPNSATNAGVPMSVPFGVAPEHQYYFPSIYKS